MKFVFKLKNLLNIKIKLEEAQKIQYGKSVAKLEKERENLQNLYTKKINNIQNIKKNIQKSINPNYIKTVNIYIKEIDKNIKEQQENIKKAEEIVEKEKEKLLIAMKEKKILETLEEKEKENYQKEMLKQEQKSIDEIVSYKYNKV